MIHSTEDLRTVLTLSEHEMLISLSLVRSFYWLKFDLQQMMANMIWHSVRIDFSMHVYELGAKGEKKLFS